MDHFRRTAAIAAAAITLASTAAAQGVPPDSAMRRQQRTLDSLVAALRVLQARVDSLMRAGVRPDTPPGDEIAALRAAAAAAAADSPPAGPRQARLGLNALNPEISVTGDVRATAWRPGPQADNFVAREFEVGFQSALDPYSVAKVFIAAEEGELSVEEGYVYWSGLPGHTRLDVGRFRQTVGELNRWHLHALPEDDYPLVLRRYAGEEGVAGDGLSVYWPLPFSGRAGAYELTLQATTGGNEVLEVGGTRPALTGQLLGFWQLTRSTYAQVSLSGRVSGNPDTALTTTLGVAAARFSWRPPDRALQREFTVRGELWALRRRFALAAPDAFDRTRLGGFVSATWRLDRRWILGLRGDRAQSPDPGTLVTEWAVTPTLTWWQSEFVFVRAGYEHARSPAGGTTGRLTLQAVFAMGPHKHELF
jgi:hypothetical protein